MTSKSSGNGSSVSSRDFEDSSISSDVALGHSSAGRALRNSRLVDWIVGTMVQYLQQVLASRDASSKKRDVQLVDYQFTKKGTNLDELVEIISLPKFDQASSVSSAAPYQDVLIEANVVQQLRKLVQQICETYRDNPFHSFEHACHVTQAW